MRYRYLRAAHTVGRKVNIVAVKKCCIMRIASIGFAPRLLSTEFVELIPMPQNLQTILCVSVIPGY